MNICEHLTVTARLFPDREAIHFEGSSLSYAQLDQLSHAAAQRLIDAGIEPGDRVAIMLPNVPAFVVWYYATLRIGAMAVSILALYLPVETDLVTSDDRRAGLRTIILFYSAITLACARNSPLPSPHTGCIA